MSHNKITGRVTGKAAVPAMDAEHMKYRAEEDLRTLQRAREIETDRSRMKAAKCCARDQMKTLAKVTGAKGKR